MTAFLFGSFSERRAELGKEFGSSGKQALAHGDAQQAIHDLRISLSYAPDDANNRLLLAESLAQANHLEEARTRFLGLLELRPADGFINLQLARLARKAKDAPQAIQYYRASAVGNWPDVTIDERFQVQMELADYLIELHRLPEARAELLIAAADAPTTSDAFVTVGDSFLEAQDPGDALSQYQRAIRLNPGDAPVLLKAARILYQTGRYANAYKLLSSAHRAGSARTLSAAESAQFQTLLENSRRVQDLSLSQNLPGRQLEQHLLRDLNIAKARFTACSAKLTGAAGNGAAPPPLPPAMQTLSAQWQAAAPFLSRRSPLDDDTDQANATTLIFNTEQQTENFCGPPVGDDALLLMLANAAENSH